MTIKYKLHVTLLVYTDKPARQIKTKSAGLRVNVYYYMYDTHFILSI